jgi:hypothetical protein
MPFKTVLHEGKPFLRPPAERAIYANNVYISLVNHSKYAAYSKGHPFFHKV